MMSTTMLTTVDNPYDPANQFTDWYAFDEAHGYHTSGMLARIMKNSDELSDADRESERIRAIKEILEENVLGLWTAFESP
jgi:hypothetical protein